MATFSIAYQETAKIEGGYSNNPNDSGGETWKGAARNKWQFWPGWKIVDTYRKLSGFPANLKTSPELQTAVHNIYKTEFWDFLRLDEVKSQLVANELYDTGVNCGISTATKFLQRALNVINQNGKYRCC